MNDREKLEWIYNNIMTVIEDYMQDYCASNNVTVSLGTSPKELALLNRWNGMNSIYTHLKIYGDLHGLNNLRANTYQSSGRPCFDKPAGVAILHGETL